MKSSLITSVLSLTSMAIASPLETRSGNTKCIKISDREARDYVNRNIAFWERKGGDRNIEKNAEGIYSKDFKLISNSARSARGLPITSAALHSSRASWVSDFKKNVPKVNKDTVIDYFIDCNTFILFQRFETGNFRDRIETQTIEIQTLEKSKKFGIVAKETRVEFDSVAFGRAFGGVYTPPKGGKGGKGEKGEEKKDDDEQRL
ncbi:hypothetical protein Slin15195_G065690 [Septoria linicola]|uniref:NTF2-like domain-containing protein n=1 Tax=Septoria linicola TaxID=215465 RepID=A0A9Q9EJP9_9PEZI|nr:hypothetical protein Slin14017_G116030 [Septoria linicola]USW53250.1 hypothetical protein Slin15195_G065690 [Septoria linicola]